VDTGQEYRVRPDQVNHWINEIWNPTLLIGHDIQAFDIPVISKFTGVTYNGPVFDTKIAARLVFPDTKLDDWRSSISGKPWNMLPKALRGSHTLKAWGIRLGVFKGDRTKQDFSQFSEEMLEYCMQDCRVTLALYKKIMEMAPTEASLKVEHEFSKVIDQQKLNGFTLDLKTTQTFLERLQKERLKSEDELKSLFPSRLVEFTTPVKKFPRTKTIIFNPGSRDQIAWNLTAKYGWKPDKFTDTGKPQIDEEVLSGLDYPEAKRLVEYLLLQKRIGQIAEGDNAWLKLVQDDEKIHGGVNTNGTVTGRCSFIAPNMGQVPRVGNPYGKECRGCFTASPGGLLVGCDASSIQLRLLAHLLAKYDNGEYSKLVTTGDIHECNRQAAGLESRNQAKTFIYALLFGAGSKKIAQIVGRSPGEGRQLLQTFFRAIPAFRRLNDDIRKVVEVRQNLQGLDGRRYPVRSAHLGLSVLLQGYEAVIMKTATINLHKELQKKGLVHGTDYKQVLHLYDENQFDVPTQEIGKLVGTQQAEEIFKAGEFYKIRCPLAGEWKMGFSWADTH